MDFFRAIAFKPVAEATIKLQDSQITFGDFFLIWEKCTFELKNHENALSKVIAFKIDKRRQNLMNNKAFLAAIFVDQRINFRNSPFISSEERTCALVRQLFIALYQIEVLMIYL